MALFVNPGKDWEKNMSEEDIAQMESQGYDVTELRAKRAKSAEEEEKERLREKEERENFKNPTNLNKLAPYLQTPRDMSTSFSKLWQAAPLAIQRSLEKKIYRGSYCLCRGSAS
ncbi:hypothetical protein NXW00_13805 [Bacteroides thetaiotaomicron]|nr:hypothetical protein [Bacteroides thetaiotaomicron]